MRKLDYPFFIGTIENEKDMYYISDNFCRLFSKDELVELAKGIERFVEKYGDEIENINERRRKENEQEYQEWQNKQREKAKEKERTNAKIYIMECNGRYKIGLSKLVENRLKQLDNRPFPCKVIFKSSDTKYAYEIEQEIHIRLSKRRIKGEWYEMSNKIIKKVEDEIEELIKKYETGVYQPDRLKELRKYWGTHYES